MARLSLLLSVALGGALGSVARYLVTVAAQSRTSSAFPVGTLLVNVSGSIVLGFLLRYGLEATTASPETRLLLTAGFCGGFTTFSAFAFETARFLEEGRWQTGAAYVLGSVILSLGGTFIGFALARALLSLQRS